MFAQSCRTPSFISKTKLSFEQCSPNSQPAPVIWGTSPFYSMVKCLGFFSSKRMIYKRKSLKRCIHFAIDHQVMIFFPQCAAFGTQLIYVENRFIILCKLPSSIHPCALKVVAEIFAKHMKRNLVQWCPARGRRWLPVSFRIMLEEDVVFKNLTLSNPHQSYFFLRLPETSFWTSENVKNYILTFLLSTSLLYDIELVVIHLHLGLQSNRYKKTETREDKRYKHQPAEPSTRPSHRYILVSRCHWLL